MLAQVVTDSPFRARELIDRVCAGTSEAFGFKRVEWQPPDGLVPVPGGGRPAARRGRPLRAERPRRGGRRRRRPRPRRRPRRPAEVSTLSRSPRTSCARRSPSSTESPPPCRSGSTSSRSSRCTRSSGRSSSRRGACATSPTSCSTCRESESGSVSAHPRAPGPHERLIDLIPAHRGRALARTSQVLVDPGLELVTDPVGFERVAANLILNALRYGQRLPVEVRGKSTDPLPARGRGPRPRVSQPEFVPRLFERFSRSDDSRRSGTAGSGLGLSIASAYAEAMGGWLDYVPAANCTGRASRRRHLQLEVQSRALAGADLDQNFWFIPRTSSRQM